MKLKLNKSTKSAKFDAPEWKTGIQGTETTDTASVLGFNIKNKSKYGVFSWSDEFGYLMTFNDPTELDDIYGTDGVFVKMFDELNEPGDIWYDRNDDTNYLRLW